MSETNFEWVEIRDYIRKIGKFEKISYEQWHKDYGDNDQHTFDAVLDEIPMPKRATKGSAGYDFITPFDIHFFQLVTNSCNRQTNHRCIFALNSFYISSAASLNRV